MLLIVSFPVLDENVHEYELAANVQSRAVVVLSSSQSDLAFCGHVCRRDLLDVNESAMTRDGREDVCKMHAVHKASGFRHLYWIG